MVSIHKASYSITAWELCWAPLADSRTLDRGVVMQDCRRKYAGVSNKV